VIFRRFFRHIKEGFIGVKRHFGNAVSSASAVTITLLLLGVFVVFAINLNRLTQEIEQSLSLVALVDYDVTDRSTIDSIMSKIERIDGVDEVVYRTKEQEFDFYINEYADSDTIEFTELYRQDNPFHDAFLIYMVDGVHMENVKTEVSKLQGIDEVQDGGSYTYTLINILHASRNIGFIFILALMLLAIYLIYNTIKITISTRKDEIWIMNNVGARNGYIRAPFLVEGIIIGLFGSLIAIGFIAYGYYRLYEVTGGTLAGILKLVEFYPFILYLSGILLAIGILVGFIGSYISVCKYLRLSR